MDYDVEPNSTTGIWIGADDVELFEAFDAYFQAHGQQSGEYSRGERIKRAMVVYMAAHDEIRQDAEMPHPDSWRVRELVATVRNEIKYEDDEIG